MLLHYDNSAELAPVDIKLNVNQVDVKERTASTGKLKLGCFTAE